MECPVRRRQLLKFFICLMILKLVSLLYYLPISSLEFKIRNTDHFYTSYREDQQRTKATPKVDVFQSVNEDFPLFHVFNAYEDYRGRTSLVRVLAVGYTDSRPLIFCHIQFPKQWITVAAGEDREKFLSWLHGMDGFFLVCPLESPTDHPIAVSISTSVSEVGTNLIRIRRIPRPPSDDGPGTITSCVAPLYGSVRPAMLSEWIELNRLLGVEHFVFYNYSIPPSISRLLHHYEQRGIVTTVPWLQGTFPFEVSEAYDVWPPHPYRLHYYGQVVTNNDCLYRSMNRRRYTIFIDLDEVVVPYKDSTLAAYMDRIMASSNPTAFCFYNAYFYKEYPDDKQMLSYKDLTLLKKTMGDTSWWNTGFPWKVAVVKDRAMVMAIHKIVWEWSGSGVKTASRGDALLHHYKGRGDKTKVRREMKKASRVPILLKFAETVARNVREVLVASGNIV